MDSAANPRGQWVVVLRDVPANEDQYLGPYRSEDRADDAAARLNRDAEAVGASHLVEAFVKWMQPADEFVDLRDEMLADLEEMGYVR